MNTTHRTFIIATAAILVVVQPGFAQEKEKRVAFRTAEGKYLTADTGNALTLSGTKIDSKQTFTLIDLNGGDLADKDEVRVRYTPNSGGKPDPSKASYWKEISEGIKRAREGDVFKVKLVESKYAFVAPSGKFVGQPLEGGVLGVTTNVGGALTLELVDVLPKTNSAPKSAKQPTAD